MKIKTLRQHKLDGELGLIIEEMGRAMWNANRKYIGRSLRYGDNIRFTPSMLGAWNRYVDFCARNSNA